MSDSEVNIEYFSPCIAVMTLVIRICLDMVYVLSLSWSYREVQCLKTIENLMITVLTWEVIWIFNQGALIISGTGKDEVTYINGTGPYIWHEVYHVALGFFFTSTIITGCLAALSYKVISLSDTCIQEAEAEASKVLDAAQLMIGIFLIQTLLISLFTRLADIVQYDY